jgi:hypothetical protein
VLNIDRRGRALTRGDGFGAPPVAIVNQTGVDTGPMATRLPVESRFSGRNPDDEPARQIVGIVGNVRDGIPSNRMIARL